MHIYVFQLFYEAEQFLKLPEYSLALPVGFFYIVVFVLGGWIFCPQGMQIFYSRN